MKTLFMWMWRCRKTISCWGCLFQALPQMPHPHKRASAPPVWSRRGPAGTFMVRFHRQDHSTTRFLVPGATFFCSPGVLMVTQRAVDHWSMLIWADQTLSDVATGSCVAAGFSQIFYLKVDCHNPGATSQPLVWGMQHITTVTSVHVNLCHSHKEQI